MMAPSNDNAQRKNARMFSICTLNCSGLRGGVRRRMLKHEWKAMNADVLFLQETHVACVKEGQSVERELECKAVWSFGTGSSCGMGILLSNKLDFKIIKFIMILMVVY